MNEPIRDRAHRLGRPAAPTALISTLLLLAPSALAGDVGTLIQFQAQTPARASEVNQNFDAVKTAVNSKLDRAIGSCAPGSSIRAIDSGGGVSCEIDDAGLAGIDFSSSDTPLALGTDGATPTIVSSVTVTAPGAGFVVVDFSSYLSLDHVSGGGPSYVVCAIKTDTTNPDLAPNRLVGSRRFISLLSDEASGTHFPHVAARGVHSVSAAGSVTFNALCYGVSNSTGAEARSRTLTAIFHANRY